MNKKQKAFLKKVLPKKSDPTRLVLHFASVVPGRAITTDAYRAHIVNDDSFLDVELIDIDNRGIPEGKYPDVMSIYDSAKDKIKHGVTVKAHELKTALKQIKAITGCELPVYLVMLQNRLYLFGYNEVIGDIETAIPAQKNQWDKNPIAVEFVIDFMRGEKAEFDLNLPATAIRQSYLMDVLTASNKYDDIEISFTNPNNPALFKNVTRNFEALVMPMITKSAVAENRFQTLETKAKNLNI